MKKLLILLLLSVSCFMSCTKGKDAAPNNNEVKATVVVSPTSTITINARGSKATMGTSIFGIGTYINGTNESNAAVYITAFGGGLQAVTVPGTYSYVCEYRVNVSVANTPIYTNNGLNGGSITFTRITDKFMEGYFNAVCRCNSPGCVFGVDSVIVNGTFKGDHLNF